MRFAAAILFFSLAASPLHAQWSVDAQAGRIRSTLDPLSTGSESLVLGARYEQLHTALRVSAGVPTTDEQPLWGAIAGAHRFAVRPGFFVAGVDLAANAVLLHDRVQRTQQVGGVFPPRTVAAPSNSGFATALQAMPVIGVEMPRVRLHVRGGVSRYTSEIAEQRRDRNVTLADAQLAIMPTSSMVFMPSVRHFSAQEGDYTYGGAAVVLSQGAVTLWGSTGHWLDLPDQEMTWALGAGLRMNDRITLSASGSRDVFDPLYATAGQTSWNVGLSVKLGQVMPARLPTPSVFDAGQATIRLPVSQSPDAPRVAGDFNAWKPQSMQRRGDAWVLTVTLQPGVYNYAFVDANDQWFVPEQHPGRKQDGMGGEVAVLVVR